MKLFTFMHCVLTGCVIIFEMTVTPSLFIKSPIYTCRADMCQMINHLHQKKCRSNCSIEKLHETNYRVIEVVIRCVFFWKIDIFSEDKDNIELELDEGDVANIELQVSINFSTKDPLQPTLQKFYFENSWE